MALNKTTGPHFTAADEDVSPNHTSADAHAVKARTNSEQSSVAYRGLVTDLNIKCWEGIPFEPTGRLLRSLRVGPLCVQVINPSRVRMSSQLGIN